VPTERAEPPHEVHAIGNAARRALAGAGLTTWDAVDAAPDADLLALHGFGPKALRILRDGSAGRG
jgi:predicted flap endonuclease-1-like 5' DNA nuclease